MKPPVKLKASETGPLELVFFLKNTLPNTNIRNFGKIRVDIYPPIVDPRNNVNGNAMRCTFFTNVETNCDWLTDDITFFRSSIMIYTPQEFSFK
jgi:hypothetical protein